MSFSVDGVTNAGSVAPSEPFKASWTAKDYSLVAEYAGALTVTNDRAGDIEHDAIRLYQGSRDFGVRNQYTLRFSPTNPIPDIGWIKITYPEDVAIEEDAIAFAAGCQCLTAALKAGPQHCRIDFATRTIWIYGAFVDQKSYTSEVSVSFHMTNPGNNFVPDTSSFTPKQLADMATRKSFHVSTYTLDLKQLTAVLPSLDPATSLPSLADTVIANPEKYLKVIDDYPGSDIRAQLKCKAPCLRCLDADPSFCTACWGINQLSLSGNGALADPAIKALIFLQADQGAQTCRS